MEDKDRQFIKVPTTEKPVDFTQKEPIAPFFKSKEKQSEIVRDIIDNGERAKQDRSEYSQRVAEYLSQWRGESTSGNAPFDNCSDTHVLKTYSTVQIVQSRLSSVLLETDPIATFMTSNPDDLVKNRLREDVFNWVMTEKVDYFNKLNLAFRNACRDGDSYIKIGWKKVQRLVKENKIVGIDESLMATGGPALPIFDDVVGVETLFDWPDLKIISPLDIILPVNSDGVQSEDGDFIIHRLKIPIDTLKRRQKNGFYTNVDKIQTSRDDNKNKSDTSGELDLIQDIRDRGAGLNNTRNAPSDAKLVEVWEFWGARDINGDGFDEEVVITIVPEDEIILRAAPNPFIHGKRPFVKFEFEPVENTPYSIGLAEIIQPSEDMLNSLRNLRLDLVTLAAAPILLVSEQMFAKLKNKKLNPGDVVPVDDPSDINILKWPTVDPSIFQAEADFDNTIQEASGVTDFQRGNEQVNRPTARGTIALLTQAQERLRPLITRFQKKLEEVYTMAFSNMQQFLPAQVNILILGDEGAMVPRSVSRIDLEGDFSLIISATSGNRQAQNENELNFMNLALQLFNVPIDQQTAQTGIDIRAMLRRIGKNMKIKDLDSIILSRDQTNELLEQQIRLKESEIQLAQLQLAQQQPASAIPQQTELQGQVPVQQRPLVGGTTDIQSILGGT